MKYTFFIALLFVLACQAAIDKEQIYGTWKAAAFIDNGKKSEIDLTNVEFKFNPDGTYHYHGTLEMEESGRYYLTGKLLYTTDTTQTKGIEKSVKIAKLTADSLFFQMNAGGVPQSFELYKAK